jgi:hypothetical protein
MFAVAMLAAATLPTSAAAKSPRDEFSLALFKRSSDSNGKSGVCVCKGGILDRRIGQITRGGVQNGNDVYLVLNCQALAFDPETGETTDATFCDEGWTTLPR